MLKQPNGMLSLALSSIIFIAIIMLSQTIFRPPLMQSSDDPISDAAEGVNLEAHIHDRGGAVAKPSFSSSWAGESSSGKIIINSDGSLSSSWKSPNSHGQVIINSDGSLSSSWDGPYSRGEVVVPRQP